MKDEEIFELAESNGFQDDFGRWNFTDDGLLDFVHELRQALAQPEQEPVVYLDEGLGAFYWPNQYKKGVGFTPLYAVPPHRWSNVTDDCLMEEVRRRGFVIRDAQVGKKWVGLTDEEIKEFDYSGTRIEFVRAIEAKLRSKNNG